MRKVAALAAATALLLGFAGYCGTPYSGARAPGPSQQLRAIDAL